MKKYSPLPTMGDVARHAGVSPATVARVLYEPEKVSLEKRTIVQEALKATGYRPNAAARGLRTQRSGTIGLVVVDGTLNPFFSQLSQAIRNEALERGYNVLMFQHGMKPEREAKAVTQLLQQRADAVIFAYGVNAEGMAPLLQAGIPVVQIEQEVCAGTDAVLIDPVVGINAAVEHLCTLGHERIAFIGGDPALYDRPRVHGTSMDEDRLDAFRAAVRKHGASEDGGLIRLGLYFTTTGDDPAQAGREMMHALLQAPRRPTAVLASGDILAAGALQALGEAGLSVPGDMSVIGFDNSIANLLNPPLSSIGRPLVDIGRCALDLVVNAINGQDNNSEPNRITFPTELVLRHSTRKRRA
nr:LacI family DNA-binding transcriptional regulator [uncultured Cohaesibacter sp.]